MKMSETYTREDHPRSKSCRPGRHDVTAWGRDGGFEKGIVLHTNNECLSKEDLLALTVGPYVENWLDRPPVAEGIVTTPPSCGNEILILTLALTWLMRKSPSAVSTMTAGTVLLKTTPPKTPSLFAKMAALPPLAATFASLAENVPAFIKRSIV